MNVMESYYHQLNREGIDRYRLWAPYRNAIFDQIKGYIQEKGINPRSLLVIGAGNLDDLDLKKLQTIFSIITLSDIDTEHIEIGLLKQGISPSSVQIVRTELTGFEDNHFFEEIIKKILPIKTPFEMDSLLDHYLSQVSSYQFLPEYKESQDVILVSPIYTQIIIHQLFRMTHFLRNQPASIKTAEMLESTMLSKMGAIIDRINDNLIKLVKPDGKMIILSDIFEGDDTSTFFEKIHHNLNRPDVLDEIYQEYHHQYGFGLGDYGIYSMTLRSHLEKSEWLLWPFDYQHEMLVKCCFFSKK